MNIEKVWNIWNEAGKFSGVFSVSDEQGVIFEKCCGFRNKSEGLPNNRDTAFGIASGTKLFTGLAVCKLIDAGKLSLDDKLLDLLPYDLSQLIFQYCYRIKEAAAQHFTISDEITSDHLNVMCSAAAS